MWKSRTMIDTCYMLGRPGLVRLATASCYATSLAVPCPSSHALATILRQLTQSIQRYSTSAEWMLSERMWMEHRGSRNSSSTLVSSGAKAITSERARATVRELRSPLWCRHTSQIPPCLPRTTPTTNASTGRSPLGTSSLTQRCGSLKISYRLLIF
jgi:hypothetical protein